MMIGNCVLVFTVVFSCVSGLLLPSYIKRCRQDDSFNKCALESAKAALPSILKGDKKFQIPNMLPLEVPLVEVESGKNFKIKIHDLKVFGLDSTIPLAVESDFQNHVFKVVLEVDSVNLIGNYEIDGKILVFPIVGKGPANITLYGPIFTYTNDWTIIEKNGEMYSKPMNAKIDYTVKKVHYQFGNLFNGDEKLGLETNKILNENWMVVHGDLKDAVGQTMVAIVERVLANLYDKIPYKELFEH